MPSSEVMHKWKHGKLHSGSKTGPEVKSQKQALAIMFSERRAEEKHGGRYPEKRVSGGPVQPPSQRPPLSPAMQAIRDRIARGEMKIEQAPTWAPDAPDQRAFGGAMPPNLNPMMGQGVAGPMGMTPGGVMPRMPMPMNSNVTQQPQSMGVAGGQVLPTTPRQLAPGGIAQPGVGNFNMAKQANVTPSPMMRSEQRSVMHGPVMSAVPGRTDAHKTAVPSGSYVIPSDVVSGRGQGNTLAGMNVLQRMFKMGPYGTPGGSLRPGRTMPGAMRPPKMQSMMGASGGGKQSGHVGKPTPVDVAGGELVVPPQNLMQVVHPNLETAHKIMDKWVVNERKKHIKTLSKLPGPVKD